MRSERIYDERHDYDPAHVMHIETTDDTNALRLIVVDDDNVATIQLSITRARALRLALTRWERSKS